MNISFDQNLFVIILGIWLVLFVTGRYQMNQIKRKTMGLVLDHAKIHLKKYPAPDLMSFYKEIYPTWEEMVRRTAIFVPHKSELFPVAARPEKMRDQIHFSAEWVGAFLEKNGYEISATPEQQQKIKAILAKGVKRRPPQRNQEKNPSNPQEMRD